jgi:hypothetical protein
MKAWNVVTLALTAALAAGCASEAEAVGGLTDLTVFDRTEGRQLPVYWHQGRAYVAGRPGNEYRITLRNRVREEVLAVVSVDGVNVVTGETAEPRQSGYVVAPWRPFEIGGWRKSLGETAAFYFTSLPDSYAARTGRPNEVGVIGVALFRRAQPQPPAPIAAQPYPYSRDEPRAAERAAPNAGMRSQSGAAARSDVLSSAPAAEPQVGTGHGRRERSDARYVDFERSSYYPAEVITLYYDSYQNLVARGIVRESTPVAPLPRPFPGFAPDPRG